MFIHISLWLFVVFAFVDKELARINLTYIIPIIYVLHILPFHILHTLECICNKNCEEDTSKVQKKIGFFQTRDFFRNSFQNPLSPQGMLVLGSILSYYKIRTSNLS
tara:strand:+ start:477 stop:794 length:318 start_codon:yes stop_codon:yes gene_type:complete